MSETVSPKAPIAQAIIEGRCLNVRKAGQSFLHLVAMPAPDPYSHPSVVEVVASERIAEKESPFRALVKVTGYARQYKATDRDTGEERLVRTADTRLVAVL